MIRARLKTGFLGRMVQRGHYAYANARVRARRAKLLPRDSYSKLLKMDVPQITQFIGASEYGRDVDELATKFTGIDLLENSLNVNEERNYHEIRRLAKGEVGTLVTGYLGRYVIWNLKTILRGRLFGAPATDIQRELLIETREDYDFYQGLMDAEGQALQPFIDALGSTRRGLEYAKILRPFAGTESNDPMVAQKIEDALDRAYYARLVETIPGRDPDNAMFLRFVRHEIDVLNLSILLRFEWRNDATTQVLDFLLPGGHELKDADLRRLAEANTRQELVERLKEYRLYESIKDALAQGLESGSLTPVLLALTRHLADSAQSFSHRNPLSVLPIVNYLMRKHLEVRNLRAIARGKAAGLSEAQIEALLVVI